MKKLVCSSLVFVFIFMIAAPVFSIPPEHAGPPEHISPPGHANPFEPVKVCEDLIEIVDPYIEIKGNKFVINNVRELKQKISQEEYKLVRENVVYANSINSNQ